MSNVKTTSGTVKRNQGSPANVGDQPVPGRKGLGCAGPYPANMGAGNESAAGLRFERTPRDSRIYLGGQASSPSLFGLPGCTSRPGQAKAPTLAPLAGESAAALSRRQDRAAAARSPETQLERAKAFFATKDAAKQKPVAVPPPAPLALTLRITRERLAVFATLATIEQRPLDEVIAECLADMAAHLTRTRSRLRLDEADRVSLERYLDSLECEEEERTARVATTPAMRLAAHQSDMREAFPHYHHDEEADFAHRCAGAGYVETLLAIEG